MPKVIEIKADIQQIETKQITNYKEFKAINCLDIELEICKKIDFYANKYGNDVKLMLKIAMAESAGRQFNKDGTILRGQINNKDIGIFQLNEFYWLKKSKELNLDIYSLNGNIEMANWIMKNYGNSPWNWSKNKWDK